MKKQITWIVSLLIAAMGQTGAFAQDIRVDMNKVYPEKTIQLDEVASVRYIPLGTTDDVLFNGKIVHLSDEGILCALIIQQTSCSIRCEESNR